MIIFIIGTRSEAIKFSTIIRECQKRGLPFKILNTGQHGQQVMIDWMKKLDLPEPNINMGESLREIWSRKGVVGSIQIFSYWVFTKFPKLLQIFKKEKPKIVIYQGDTVFVPLTALTARLSLSGILLAHRESGMRSHNLLEPIPEEINRVIADRFTDIHFCPTPTAVKNLKREKTHGEIHYVGDPMVEIVEYVLRKFKFKVKYKNYVAVSLHRFENINSKKKMKMLVETIEKCPFNVVFPLNLNTKRKLERFNLLSRLETMDHIYLSDSITYMEWLNIVKNSEAVLTDSGGLQEEACILKIPCILMRNLTEWVETVETGATVLTGFNPEKILYYLEDVKKHGKFYRMVKKAKNPLGDGKASKRIVDVLEKKLGG
ncbi:MAG: UDP-N-acetylglucosamine 2-epimerase (non-hydrolyzing) [Candidatus Aenigmatarchaeota archaeon]